MQHDTPCIPAVIFLAGNIYNGLENAYSGEAIDETDVKMEVQIIGWMDGC